MTDAQEITPANDQVHEKAQEESPVDTNTGVTQ